MSSYLDSPHPLLKQPELYIVDPPAQANLKWTDLQEVFSSCGNVSSGGRHAEGGRRWWLVIFEDVFHAEMALVTLQGAIVPGVIPPFQLRLFHSSEFQEPFPKARLLSQFVRRSSALPHPILHRATPQQVFTYFRRAGPLVYLNTALNIGYPDPVIVLEYWEEKHANLARTRGRTIHEALLQYGTFTLRTFDPCNLFCGMLGATMQIQDMYRIFGKYGRIDAVRLVKRGVPDAFGFVSFFDPRHAAAAIHDLNFKSLPGGTTPVVVRCHEPANQTVTKAWNSEAQPLAHLNSTAPNASSTGTAGTTPINPQENSTESSEQVQEDIEGSADAETRAEAARKAEEASRSHAGREEETRQAEENACRTEETRQRRLEKQQRRERAQEAERLARKKREDAIVHEEAQRHLHRLSRAVFDGLESKLAQAERRCQDAKRLWLDAMDLQSRIARELEVAKEGCESALDQERMAEAQRAFAEQEEAEMRAAREQAEADELQADEDEETRRLAELAELIQRMQELQRIEEEDQADKKRKEEEHRRGERHRQEEETRREREDQERLGQEQRERDTREKLEKEELAQRQAEERLRRYEEAAASERARCFKRDQNPRPWTPRIAVMHFKTVSAEFDDIRFCDTQPLTFESVPWPILHSPEQRSLDAVEWGAVEAFFKEIKTIVDCNDYKQLVERAHRRFHPDKWKSRGLLNAVLDESLREKLEAAGNIVAQAMTPIWLKSKSTS